MSLIMRKAVFGVSDQVCTATEDGLRLETSDIEIKRIVLSM